MTCRCISPWHPNMTRLESLQNSLFASVFGARHLHTTRLFPSENTPASRGTATATTRVEIGPIGVRLACRNESTQTSTWRLSRPCETRIPRKRSANVSDAHDKMRSQKTAGRKASLSAVYSAWLSWDKLHRFRPIVEPVEVLATRNCSGRYCSHIQAGTCPRPCGFRQIDRWAMRYDKRSLCAFSVIVRFLA